MCWPTEETPTESGQTPSCRQSPSPVTSRPWVSGPSVLGSLRTLFLGLPCPEPTSPPTPGRWVPCFPLRQEQRGGGFQAASPGSRKLSLRRKSGGWWGGLVSPSMIGSPCKPMPAGEVGKAHVERRGGIKGLGVLINFDTALCTFCKSGG